MKKEKKRKEEKQRRKELDFLGCDLEKYLKKIQHPSFTGLKNQLSSILLFCLLILNVFYPLV